MLVLPVEAAEPFFLAARRPWAYQSDDATIEFIAARAAGTVWL